MHCLKCGAEQLHNSSLCGACERIRLNNLHSLDLIDESELLPDDYGQRVWGYTIGTLLILTGLGYAWIGDVTTNLGDAWGTLVLLFLGSLGFASGQENSA